MFRYFVFSFISVIIYTSCSNFDKKYNQEKDSIAKNTLHSGYDSVIKFSNLVFNEIKNESDDSLVRMIFLDNIKRDMSKIDSFGNHAEYEFYANLKSIPRIGSQISNYYLFKSVDFRWENMSYVKSTCIDYTNVIKLSRCNRFESEKESRDRFNNLNVKYFLSTIFFIDNLTKCDYFVEVIIEKKGNLLKMVPCNFPVITKIPNTGH